MPTLFGFLVILVLLLFAVQVTFDLYARSAVTSAAVDAVDRVTSYSAAAGGGPAMALAEQDATTRAMQSLGGYARATTFTWSPDPPAGTVSLSVSFDAAKASDDLARGLSLPLLNSFHRTVQARFEQIVCPPSQSCSVVGGS
jgi:hypothetical protein